MNITCEYCKHFELTGETAIGIPYELGGICRNEKKPKAYCNGGEDACTEFCCNIAGADAFVKYANDRMNEQIKAYEALYAKYKQAVMREEQQKNKNADDMKSYMLDGIMKAIKDGATAEEVLHMLWMCDYILGGQKNG